MTPQVVLTLAGLGSRFRASGFMQSKPLIAVDGVPMFEQALGGLDPIGSYELVVVVRADQVENERIDAVVHRFRPEARVAVIPAPTRGAAESAMAAEPFLDPAHPVVVLDCDLRFRSDEYVRTVRAFCDGTASARACVLTFTAADARYSYALLDPRGRVVEVAEKRVISQNAIAGAYLFASAGLFLTTAGGVVGAGLHEGLPEFYMSALLQRLVRDGTEVVAAEADEYESFGTPEELERSLQVRHAV